MSGLGQNPEAGETGIGRQRFREAALAIGKEIGAVENFLRDALRGHHENADRLLEIPAKVKQLDGVGAIAVPPDRKLRTEPDLLIGVEIQPLQQIEIGNSGLLIGPLTQLPGLAGQRVEGEWSLRTEDHGGLGPGGCRRACEAPCGRSNQQRAAIHHGLLPGILHGVLLFRLRRLYCQTLPGAAKPACAAGRKFAPHLPQALKRTR